MSDEIETIEVSLQEAKDIVEMRDKAIRLSKNKDFQVVIMEGYLKDEAVRLTSLLGDPDMKDSQDDIQNDLYAISSFHRYLRKLKMQGDMMEKAVMDLEEELQQQRMEGSTH